MSLLKWNRGNRGAISRGMGDPMLRFRSEMDRLMDRFFDDPWNSQNIPEAFAGTWQPAIDIAENDSNIVLRAELPGLDAKDIDVNVTGNRLTISGEKTEEKEEKGKGSYYCERTFGRFRREVELPDGIDSAKVDAQFSNGVLTLTLPRTAASKARQIEVKPAAASKESTQRVAVGAGR